MQRFRATALALAALLCGAAAVQGQTAQTAYRVSTVKDFLAAIGSNRTIILAKGDYLLSSGYAYKSGFVSWNDYDDGKELAIHNAVNLTIRGVDGARIVSDSATAYILGIYGGRNVTLDNLAILRRPKGDAEVSGGTLYAESVTGLFVDRSQLTGPSTNAIELSGAKDVRITRSSIEASSSSALSVSSSSGIEVSGSSIAKNSGYPLFYFEESDQIALTKDKLLDNKGGNLVEIYAESGSIESIVFRNCDFQRNEVDYFSGTSILPATEDCSFTDNSFAEDWAESSVASNSDESAYGDDSGPAYYEQYASGLSFNYPQGWELQEKGDKTRVGFFSPDGETLVLFATVYPLPANADPAKQGAKLFASGAAALTGLLKSEVGVEASISAAGQSFDAGGFPAQDYQGTATKADGGQASLRVRLFISKGAVHALVGMAKDGSSLDEGGEADSIFSSVQLIPEEQSSGE